MSEPSFLSVAQRDRREEHRCPEGATERCERDFLRVAPCVGNSNAIRVAVQFECPQGSAVVWSVGNWRYA
jgi:hypothetical protein